MIELACVPPNRVSDIWPLVAPLLKSAIDRTGLSEWHEIEADILYGNSLLWLCMEDHKILCAGVTTLEKVHNKLACVIVACGGTGLPQWVHLLEKIEIYAKAENCHCVRIFGRTGWARVLTDYKTTNIVLEKRLV